MTSAPPIPVSVDAAFQAFPARPRRKLLAIRQLILVLAEQTGTGPLTETLKWGEPAYLTGATGSGTTIRLGWKEARPDSCEIYVSCNTDLVDRFRTQYPDDFTYMGNRCLSLPLDIKLPSPPLEACLKMALTYHRDKRKKRQAS